ncbi:MAG: caspase family protein [Planctomycetes bacterium]|nr:caspase family protein [Planctomycetota bacterium]
MFRCRSPFLLASLLVYWLTGFTFAEDVKKPPAPTDGNRPRLVLQGRPGIPDALAISPDGKLVITRGQLWDVASGRQIRTFAGHGPGAVTTDGDEPWFWIASVAFSPDGTRLLTGGDDQTARLWDVVTGKELLLLKWPVEDKGGFSMMERVKTVGFSADGKLIVTGSGDTARIWNAATGKELFKLKGHSGSIISASFSPDGKQIFTGSEDQTGRLWDAVAGKELFKLEGYQNGVRGAFSADGKQILTTDGLGASRLWDASNGKEIKSLTSNGFAPPRPPADPTGKGDGGGFSGSPARDVAFSSNGKEILYVDSDGVSFLDATSGKRLRRIEDRDACGQAAALSKDGKYVLTSGGVLNDGGVVTLWDAATKQKVREFKGYEGLWAPIASADGKLMLTFDQTWNSGPIARVWDVAAGRELRQFKGPHEQGNANEVCSAGFSLDGRKLFAVSGNAGQREGHLTQIWDLTTGRELCRLKGFTSPAEAVFSPDGEQILTVSAQGTFTDGRPSLGRESSDKDARLWNANTGEEIRQFNGHTEGITALAFSPDGKQIATGSSDKTTRVWDAANGKQLWSMEGHASRITSISFSADGKRVITGSIDHTARIWDAAKGEELLVLRGDILAGDSEMIQRVVFSPDGKFVITGGTEVTRIWDATSGKQIHKLAMRGNSSVTFRPDGKLALLSSGSTTRMIKVLDGQDICSLVSLQDGSWVAVTPDGRFDADRLEGTRGLHWVMPDDPLTPLSIDTFMRDYYEPKLLHRILAGEQFKAIRSVAELNRVQPEIKITKVVSVKDHPDEVSVTVEVTGRSGTFSRPNGPVTLQSGVFDLHLFRDGRLVVRHPTEDGEVKLDAKTGQAAVTFGRVRLPRQTGQKEVEFSAYAFNVDRVKSETHRLKHPLPENLTPRKGTAYVMCVGVNIFDDSKLNLRFAAADARAMAASLGETLKRSDRFDRVVVVPLISEERMVAENAATKGNIQTVLALLAGQKVDQERLKSIPAAADVREARPEDVVVLTFSSHGHNGTDGRFYLLPSDIGTGHKGQITDELLQRSISTDELSKWLRGVDAGEMVMIVDACHSAGSVEQDGFKPGPMGSRGLGQLAYDKRMRILAASQADDVAFEDARIGHGLLTYALCRDGLGDGRADFEPADKQITLGEWLRYGVRRVPELTEAIANGKVQATSVTGRPLRKLGQKQTVAQQPSLFDFTQGADVFVLTKASEGKQTEPKKE